MNHVETNGQFVKTPLIYQLTEYDCGTTSIINALRYLFYRNEISPEILKYLMQYTLDKSNEKGEVGKGGTSTLAMHYLCNWLNENAPKKGMNLKCNYIPQKECSIYNNDLEEAIKKGGVAILRVCQSGDHYCLLTKMDEKYAYIFDPYYFNHCPNFDKCFEFINDKPFEYNRKVLKTRMNEKTEKDFALVDNENKEIIVIERI